ncbi:TonB-dependent siderophore receptor [Pleomorphomonas carboxyditropha]|uniref:TonB-dependent siderophore receptor n=1 Tax=Pleomorphomonas carboxyditropha TaxID=2023338 RepID=A0A2G9WR63_9HYPH|nr:TonB-dependent siderophore receptor [Pleomorphomonas carboxyditropha]PIO97211.1 TonB-dependent siderophore receptor [Pleomorphomonas carboxyditropha]
MPPDSTALIRALTLTLAALPLTGAAHAQSTTPTVTLDEIVVQGEGGSGTAPVKGYVAKATTTGAKTDTPIEKVPQSVSVMGREEIDARAADKVDEALRYTPGVFAQPFGPDGDTNWLYIRGFQATQSGIYLDGLQSYSYAFGGFLIDSNDLERIETLRGASSVLYGGSNPGGLVNLVSKRPTGERIRKIETGIDNNGYASFGFDIGDKLSDTVAARVSGRIAGGDGYTDFEENFRGTVSPSIKIDLSDTTELTVLANYTHLDGVHNGGAFLPYVGTVVAAPFGYIDREANFTEPDIDDYEREQGSLGYELKHNFGNGWKATQATRVAYSDVEESSLYPYGYTGWATSPAAGTDTLTRINFAHHSKTFAINTDNRIEGEVNTGPLAHKLLFGIDYRLFDLDQVQASSSGTDISATNPVYGSPQTTPSAYIDQTLRQHQLGAYVQDQIAFGGGWLATLNGRYDHVWTDAVGTPAYSGDDGEWSGRAGLAYEFDNGLTPYASVSTFFNPVLGANGSGVFVPETGQQYEAGLKYRPDWIDGLFTLSVFDLTKQNVLTGPSYAQTQLGEVNSQGVELEAKVNLTENWKLTASATFMDVDITKDADAAIVGKTPYVIPETMASAWLDYTFSTGTFEGFVVGGGLRYVGSAWADNENTLKVPDVLLADARIGYSRDNWGVDLNVNNIFDTDYVASCQTAYSCGYGEGRVIKLTGHFSW